jgi:N-methylhydantoinase B
MFANQSAPSAEIVEAEQPVSVLSYEFVTDKAGSGKFRGGVPFRRDYRLNESEATLSVRSDRRAFRPFGLYGGSPGQPSHNYLNPSTENRLLPSKITMQMKKGDVFRHVHPGGGGWGDPLERDPARVLKDVRNEFLSAEKAAADYGVVVDTRTWVVDEKATVAARAAIRRDRDWSEVPKVQWHDPLPARKAAE